MGIADTSETLDSVDLRLEVLASNASDDNGPRRFRMRAYNGAVVQRHYGEFVIDMEGLGHKAKVPMLYEHDKTKIVGFADVVSPGKDYLDLEGQLSSVTSYGRQVAELSDEGFPWQASVGIDVTKREDLESGESAVVNGRQVNGPISIAREWELKETSFLMSGADSNTYAVALGDDTNTDSKEALVADTKDAREELQELLAAVPDETELVTQAFLAGETLTDIKLRIADRDKEELVAIRVEREALKAEVAELREKLELLAQLDKDAGSPGVGFSGAPEDQSERLAPVTTYDEAWERFAHLRSEFPTKSAFDAYCLREQPALKELS